MLGRSSSTHSLSLTTSRGWCINRGVHSPFVLPESCSFHLQCVTYLSSHLTRSAFPLFGLIRHVALFTLLRSSTTISIRVYLPAHKLPLWRQCNRHWHILMQSSIRRKPFRSSVLCGVDGFCLDGPSYRKKTWQYSPKAYAYPCSAPLGLTWADLCSRRLSQLWLLSIWHATWKSAFHQTTTPNTLGLYRALSAPSLSRRRGD